MARSYAKLKGSIWRDDDWRALTTPAQRLYLLLLSQPEITNCGVVPYVPTRWATMAADTTLEDVLENAELLARERFIILDDTTAEVLIRTFMKHDQITDQPKLITAAQRQYDDIQSPLIRVALAFEHPDIFTLKEVDQTLSVAYAEGYGIPYGEGYREGIGGDADPGNASEGENGFTEPSERVSPKSGKPYVRARARQPVPVDGNRQPADGNQQTVTPTSSSSPRHEPATDDDEKLRIDQTAIAAAMHAAPTNASVTDDDGPTSKLWDELAALRPTDDQISVWHLAVQQEPDRVRAIIQYAKRRGKSIPGTIDHLIRNGSWPETARDPDVASGAQGTRSHDRATDHPCPHCGIGFKTATGLHEHIELQHTEIDVAPPPPEALALAGIAPTEPPPLTPPGDPS